jgi:diguanylate cyclase (GGDEF)-like protein
MFISVFLAYGGNTSPGLLLSDILLPVTLSFFIALVAGHFGTISYRLQVVYEDLQEAHASLGEAHAKIQKQALTDPLTSLPNHRAIMDQLEKEVDRSQRFGRSFSLLFFDLDHFKALNDGYGHAGGDVALSSFGKLLDEGMRNLDTVGRWGGEEFVALFPETTLTEAQAIAERLRQRTSQQSFAIGGGLHLTCSIGVASYPEHADTIITLVNAADSAMYAAKRLGRNQVRVIDDPMVKVVLASEDGEGDREGVALQGVVEALASLLEQRDPSLGQHSSDVADLVYQLSGKLGISGQEAHMIKLAGQLHDIGKIGISDTILHTSAHLSEQEWTQIKGHSTAGAEIVAHIPALRPLAPVIRAHHERWDGQGYPDQLRQEEIPLAARVISVVDAYMAMMADRPYQKARSPQDAVAELQRCAGTQFDPRIVEALIAYLQEQGADLRAEVQVA